MYFKRNYSHRQFSKSPCKHRNAHKDTFDILYELPGLLKSVGTDKQQFSEEIATQPRLPEYPRKSAVFFGEHNLYWYHVYYCQIVFGATLWDSDRKALN
jgi:hypothetical protein